jgi:hypothetical protein
MRNVAFHIVRVITLLCIFVLVQPTTAQPVQWSGNGHYYEIVVASRISWSAAKAAAEQRVYRCRRGHLATITSREENAFIWNLYQRLLSCGAIGSQVYIGGYEDPPGSGNWKWVTGEPMNYTNWHPGEPNFSGNETVIALGLFCPGTWNNVPPDGRWGSRGFIVEYPLSNDYSGDADRNGCVDDADFLAVLFAFGSTGSNLGGVDTNCDEVVDDADLLTVLFQFGSGC